MRILYTLMLVVILSTTAAAAGKAVSYQVDGKSYEGYFITPGAGAPLVLLVHDWDGLTDYEIKRAGMLAEMGYAVFAVDLFGAGVRPTEEADKRRHTAELYGDRDEMRSRLNAGLEAARAQGADSGNAVAMGYCFGGAAVLELARSGADLKGFVSFHGGLTTPEAQDYAQTRGKLLVLHGTADTSVTMEHFATLAAALEEKGVAHEMITYGGAPHAFTVFGTERYREDADQKSWRRFGEFLSETLK
jgi:dienelactone hydrolase